MTPFISFFRGGGVKVGIFYFLSFIAGQAHEILDYVKEALIDSTMQNVFMDDVTKSKAKAKVGNINIFLRRSKTENKNPLRPQNKYMLVFYIHCNHNSKSLR